MFVPSHLHVLWQVSPIARCIVGLTHSLTINCHKIASARATCLNLGAPASSNINQSQAAKNARNASANGIANKSKDSVAHGMHAYAPTYMAAYIYAHVEYIYIYIYICTPLYTYTRVYTHIHTYTHACTSKDAANGTQRGTHKATSD